MKLSRENYFQLSSGKEFYAYGHTLSIIPNGSLVYGWDGEVNELEEIIFTVQEKKEIAKEMINRWNNWSK